MEKHFEVIPLSYDTKRRHQRSWAYVNFVQIGRLALVQQLEIPEDEQALQQISEAMTGCKVIGVPALEAVRKGGALNCMTFCLKKKNPIMTMCRSENISAPSYDKIERIRHAARCGYIWHNYKWDGII